MTPSLRDSAEAYERISEPGGLAGVAFGPGVSCAAGPEPAGPEHQWFQTSTSKAEALAHIPVPSSELPTIPPEAGAMLDGKAGRQLAEKELEELRATLLTREAKLRDLQGTLTEVSAEAARVERLRRQVAQRDARIQELEERMQVLERQVRELDAGIGKGRDRERQLASSLELTKRRTEALEAALAEAVRKLRSSDAALAQTEQQRAELERSLLSTRGSHALLERALHASERAREALHIRTSDALEHPDDLQAVKGVGPAFERALNLLGITRYEQIAAWTPEDISQVARRLRTKPERIERDGWVQSAHELAREKRGRS